MLEGELFALLEGTADAAFAVDEEGRIRSWNASAARLFGYTRPEVLNQFCYTLLQGRGGAGCNARRAAQPCALDGCHPPAFDLEVRVRSGRRIWVNVSTLVYRDERRERSLVVHLARDVTARKKNEEFARQVASLCRLLSNGDASGAPAARLSEQERRILASFAGGRNSAEIARDLGISLQTLRNHLHRINQKLGTHNRLEAVMQAMQAGLI